MNDFQGYIQLFLIWLVSSFLIRFILNRKQRKPRLPPSPPSLPIIGHLHLVSSLLHRSFHKLSLRYGPIIHLVLGSVPCVLVSTAESAKEFLKIHELSFSNRPTQATAANHISYGFQDFFFAPYGPYWKFIKKLCISELLGGRILHQLRSVRQQETLRFLRVLLDKGKAGGDVVDVGAELMKLSNNIISRMIMGQKSSGNEGEAEEIRKLVINTTEMLGKFNVSDFIWFCKKLDFQGFNKRLKETRGRFDTLWDKIIEERQEERGKRKGMSVNEGDDQVKDVLDVLLDIYEDCNSEVKLTKENIKAFILDVFVAGTDTTALTIQWALAELINHPDVMKKAREEIDAVIGKGRIVQESDIVNLPYLQAIVKETLRIHPAAPILFRESCEDSVVCGYEIPAKTRLFVNVWAIGMDPSHWVEPHKFRPERFTNEEENSEVEVRGQNYQLIPFGSGRRTCPGASLALQVVHTNLAAMVQCFEWKINYEDNETKSVNMQEKAGLTVTRAHPLICVPVPRLDPFPSI